MEHKDNSAIAHHVVALAVQHDLARVWIVNGEHNEPVVEIQRPVSHLMHVRGGQERHLHSSEAHELEFFSEISDLIANASHAVLFGHGKGNSNMKEKFLHFVQQHHRSLFDVCVDGGNIDFAALSNGQIVALAKDVWARQ
jgi:hypothetical protein